MALSRIVVSVTTVKPVAAVQVQAANTVSTSSAAVGAVVTYVIPAATIKWISIMMDAELDFRGLNPVIKEIKVVTDTAALHFRKSAFDTETVTDERTLVLFRKVPQENLLASELKTFDLQRQISDEVDATDDFYGTANADDDETMWFSKALQPDHFTAGDNLDHINFGKNPADTAVTSDQIDSFFVGKGLTDSPITSEVRVVSIQKPLADTVDAGDEMNALAQTDDGEVMFFSKDVAREHQYTSDQIQSVDTGKSLADEAATSDDKSFFVGKGLVDNPQTSESNTYFLDKSLDDVGVTSEQAAIDTSKALEDSFTKSDEALVEAGKNVESSATTGDELLPFELGKGIEDTPLTSESQQFDISRVSEDSASATEQIANTLGKPFTDRTFYPSEGPNQYDTYALTYFLEDYVREGFPELVFAKALSDEGVTSETLARVMQKPLQESFGSVDNKVFLLSKGFSESVSNSDVMTPLFDKGRAESLSTTETRAKDLEKVLADLVDATDDFYGALNSDDEQVMLYAKLVSDYAATSEAQTFSVSKALADTVGKSDLKVFDLSKPLADSVTKSDAAVKLTSKALSDAFTQSDASSYLVGKVAADSAATSEVQAFFVGKALADTFTKSDSAAKSAEKVLSDSFSKSDSARITAGKAATDTALTSEVQSFSISKSLSDVVNSTDDFYGVANADDDETMLFSKNSSELVLKSDTTTLTAGKGLTDSVSKSDSGSLVWTDYWDIGYTVTTSGVYVGNSQTF